MARSSIDFAFGVRESREPSFRTHRQSAKLSTSENTRSRFRDVPDHASSQNEDSWGIFFMACEYNAQVAQQRTR